MTKNLLFAAFFYLILVSLNSKGQTNVSGGIYANTTWTKANSPYIVTDTVVVFPGVTLTIDPGVTVKFANNIRLEIRQASLIALGTITDSITFTSNSNSPVPGIWVGIYLNNFVDAKFNYCNFYYANSSISGGMDTLFLRNSIFSNNIHTVFQVYQGQIDSCVVKNNTDGFYISFGYIDQCIATYNTNSGISGEGATVTNCIAKHNKTGIRSTSTGLHIENCTADSNSVGIECGGSITNCQIKFNGTGILIASGGPITESVIENDSIGILANGYGGLYCNKICNNYIYDVKYTKLSGGNFYMSNNYWCDTDSVNISARIYDGYDNVNLGLVSFLPVDTVGCYLTGCLLGVTATVTNATCDTCHNGSSTVHISNGFAPYIYTWYTSPLQTSQTATGLASGTYNVCVTDGNGCTACNIVFVDSSNCTGFSVNANAVNATCSSCNDGTASVTVIKGSAPYNYTWYTAPMQSTASASGLSQGTYSVCVTDLYGCSACDTVTVGIGNCSAHFNLYPDTTVAHHYWAVNMASGVFPIKYDWNWGDASPHDTTAFPSHQYAVAGFYTICLSITDSAGCTNTYCNGFYLMRTSDNANAIVWVDVVSSITTGIRPISPVSSCFVYPNPNNGAFTFSYHLLSETAELQLKDATGRTVFKRNISGKEGQESVNIPGLNNGIYYWELTSGDKAPLNGKIVVVN